MGIPLSAFRSCLAAMVALVLAGCGASSPPPAPASILESLPAQQAKAYPETVTGRFVSLADFEEVPGGGTTSPSVALSGDSQVEHFSIVPVGAEGLRRFVVNITRTGAGAMEVTLAPQAQLAFTLPEVHDFTGYALLSLALYSPSLRDDLEVTLTTAGAQWTSPRILLRSGWNTVLIDIRRLRQVPEFDAKNVTQIRLAFTESQRPVMFNLDDVMLIDNDRLLEPVPPGLSLRKQGLNYYLRLPGRPNDLALEQGSDGLWRLGADQTLLQLNASPDEPSSRQERLEAMGLRRVGTVELLELNAGRIRLAATWYFPTQAGEWVSLGIRQVRWEYTFYPDGRWITHVELNDAGGDDLDSIQLLAPQPVAWAGCGVSDSCVIRSPRGASGRWNFLTRPSATTDADAQQVMRDFLHPAQLRPTLGDFVIASADEPTAFDPSQGCYVLQAQSGHCRFTVLPEAQGLIRPIFRIVGLGDGATASMEGLAIRPVVPLIDAVLFTLPGSLRKPMAVEVRNPMPGEPLR